MEAFCSCGEDIALTEMFSEEETLVVAPNKNMETTKVDSAEQQKSEEEDRQDMEDLEGTSRAEDTDKDREIDGSEDQEAKKEHKGGKKFKFGLPSLKKRRGRKQAKETA
jgi:hypothetical protein